MTVKVGRQLWMVHIYIQYANMAVKRMYLPPLCAKSDGLFFVPTAFLLVRNDRSSV